MEQSKNVLKPKKVTQNQQHSSINVASIPNFKQNVQFNSHKFDGINSMDNTPVSNNKSHTRDSTSPFRKGLENHLRKNNIKSNNHNNGSEASQSFKQDKSVDPPGQGEENQNQVQKQDIVLAKRFKLSLNLHDKKSKIGLYIGKDSLLNLNVAIKTFGGKRPKTSKSQIQFFNQEREILLKLRTHDGFSKMIDSGYEEEVDLYYIVMQQIDEDLNSMVKKSQGGCLNLQTVVNIGLEMIERLETLHELGFVHRDLKPKNIMINHQTKQLVLIDFGLSNKFMSQYQTHIQYRSTKKILGTPLYASNNALLGKELSRRDDIESLVYILIFALKGCLPWKGQLKLEFLKSSGAKQQILDWRDPYGELCQGIEPEFREMLEYAQKLDFEEEPDYEYLESLFQVIKERYQFNDTFDWEKDQNKNHKTEIQVQNEDKDNSNTHQIKTENPSQVPNLGKSLSLRKNLKYKTVRKIKKGASGVFNKKGSDLDVLSSPQFLCLEPTQSQDQQQKNLLITKVKRNQQFKRKNKVSGKIIPSILKQNVDTMNPHAIILSPDLTKINSNEASNYASHNGDAQGDKSQNSYQPNSLDNYNRSESLQIEFQKNDNHHDNSQEEIEDDTSIPSEDQVHNHNFINDYQDCSGTAGIDFNYHNYWDQDALDETQGATIQLINSQIQNTKDITPSMVKNVPEFNHKRNIIQRNSENLQKLDLSPYRIRQLNSCTDLSQEIKVNDDFTDKND